MAKDSFLLDVQSTSAAGVIPTSIPGVATALKKQQKAIQKDQGINCNDNFNYFFPQSLYQQGMNTIIQEIDAIQCIRRYTWHNLPGKLTGELMERILYYRGSGAMFYSRTADEFFFLPYVGSGVDCYGYYNRISPTTFGGKVATDKEGKEIVNLFMKDYNLIPIKDSLEILDIDDAETNCAVILSDRSYTWNSQQVMPRLALHQPIINAMSEALPMTRTGLISGSGVKGVKVATADEAKSIQDASKEVYKAALSGNPWVPLLSSLSSEDLTNGTQLKTEEFLAYFQALDNYRMSAMGLKSAGILEKKAHMLQSESDMNTGHAELIYDDGLIQRQNFCDTVNLLWGLGISVSVSEAALDVDLNMDGTTTDDKDQSGAPGEQPAGTVQEGSESDGGE